MKTVIKILSALIILLLIYFWIPDSECETHLTILQNAFMFFLVFLIFYGLGCLVSDIIDVTNEYLNK